MKFARMSYMRQIPKFLKKYFWDVDFPRVDKKTHSRFVIERILEYGDRKTIAWMESNFEPQEIKEVVSNSKNLSKKSANFWQIILNVNKNKVLCLKKSFQKRHRLIWRH